jgi:hypothetical protein
MLLLCPAGTVAYRRRVSIFRRPGLAYVAFRPGAHLYTTLQATDRSPAEGLHPPGAAVGEDRLRDRLQARLRDRLRDRLWDPLGSAGSPCLCCSEAGFRDGLLCDISTPASDPLRTGRHFETLFRWCL